MNDTGDALIGGAAFVVGGVAGISLQENFFTQFF